MVGNSVAVHRQLILPASRSTCALPVKTLAMNLPCSTYGPALLVGASSARFSYRISIGDLGLVLPT